MNWLILGFWIATFALLGLGALMGLARGLNRSIFRIILVILCAIGAFFLRAPITDLLLKLKVGGIALEQRFTNLLPAELAGVGVILAKLVSFALVFVLIFVLLQFLTWTIVYSVGKLYVREGEKQRKGWGALVGLCQGVVVAICICMPLGGLLYQADLAVTALNNAQNSGEQVAYAMELPQEGDISAETSQENGFLHADTQQMLDGYANSLIGKFYGKVCKSSFDSIASIKTESGKITMSEVVVIAREAPKLLETVSEITSAMKNVEFSNPQSLDDLKLIMTNLDKIKDDLPESTKGTLNTLIFEMVKGMVEEGSESVEGDEVQRENATNAMLQAVATALEEVNFTDISFAAEIDAMQNVLTDFSAITSGQSVANIDVATLVEDITASKLIVPIMENLHAEDFGLDNLDENIKNSIDDCLENIDVSDAETQRTVSALRSILGIAARNNHADAVLRANRFCTGLVRKYKFGLLSV